MDEKTLEAVCKMLANLIETPCDLTPCDEDMIAHCDEWCSNHCNHAEGWECWKKWFELKNYKSINLIPRGHGKSMDADFLEALLEETE